MQKLSYRKKATPPPTDRSEEIYGQGVVVKNAYSYVNQDEPEDTRSQSPIQRSQSSEQVVSNNFSKGLNFKNQTSLEVPKTNAGSRQGISPQGNNSPSRFSEKRYSPQYTRRVGQVSNMIRNGQSRMRRNSSAVQISGVRSSVSSLSQSSLGGLNKSNFQKAGQETYSQRRNSVSGLLSIGHQGQGGGSSRSFGLRSQNLKITRPQNNVKSNRGFHYRNQIEKTAKMILEGKDTSDVETMERVPYTYCGANYERYVNNLSKKQEEAYKKQELKQAIIQKMYGDVIVGKFYNLQMRGDQNSNASDMSQSALLFDPVFFGEDTGERQEYAQMQRFNSRPKKEARPMFIGPDGKLHHKIETSKKGTPHQNRMQAIFKGVNSSNQGGISTARSQERLSPSLYNNNGMYDQQNQNQNHSQNQLNNFTGYANQLKQSKMQRSQNSLSSSYNHQYDTQNLDRSSQNRSAYNYQDQSSILDRSGMSNNYNQNHNHSGHQLNNNQGYSSARNRGDISPIRSASPNNLAVASMSKQKSYNMMTRSDRSIYDNTSVVREDSNESKESILKLSTVQPSPCLSQTSSQEQLEQQKYYYKGDEEKAVISSISSLEMKKFKSQYVPKRFQENTQSFGGPNLARTNTNSQDSGGVQHAHFAADGQSIGPVDEPIDQKEPSDLKNEENAVGDFADQVVEEQKEEQPVQSGWGYYFGWYGTTQETTETAAVETEENEQNNPPQDDDFIPQNDEAALLRTNHNLHVPEQKKFGINSEFDSDQDSGESYDIYNEDSSSCSAADAQKDAQNNQEQFKGNMVQTKSVVSGNMQQNNQAHQQRNQDQNRNSEPFNLRQQQRYNNSGKDDILDDYIQFQPRTSSDTNKSSARFNSSQNNNRGTSYQTLKFQDVNSNSDASLQNNRLRNQQLRQEKNEQRQVDINLLKRQQQSDASGGLMGQQSEVEVSPFSRISGTSNLVINDPQRQTDSRNIDVVVEQADSESFVSFQEKKEKKNKVGDTPFFVHKESTAKKIQRNTNGDNDISLDVMPIKMDESQDQLPQPNVKKQDGSDTDFSIDMDIASEMDSNENRNNLHQDAADIDQVSFQDEQTEPEPTYSYYDQYMGNENYQAYLDYHERKAAAATSKASLTQIVEEDTKQIANNNSFLNDDIYSDESVDPDVASEIGSSSAGNQSQPISRQLFVNKGNTIKAMNSQAESLVNLEEVVAVDADIQLVMRRPTESSISYVSQKVENYPSELGKIEQKVQNQNDDGKEVGQKQNELKEGSDGDGKQISEENIGDDEIDEANGSGEKPNPFDPMFRSSVNARAHFKSKSMGSTDKLRRSSQQEVHKESQQKTSILKSYAKVREEESDLVNQRFEQSDKESDLESLIQEEESEPDNQGQQKQASISIFENSQAQERQIQEDSLQSLIQYTADLNRKISKSNTSQGAKSGEFSNMDEILETQQLQANHNKVNQLPVSTEKSKNFDCLQITVNHAKNQLRIQSEQPREKNFKKQQHQILERKSTLNIISSTSEIGQSIDNSVLARRQTYQANDFCSSIYEDSEKEFIPEIEEFASSICSSDERNFNETIARESKIVKNNEDQPDQNYDLRHKRQLSHSVVLTKGKRDSFIILEVFEEDEEQTQDDNRQQQVVHNVIDFENSEQNESCTDLKRTQKQHNQIQSLNTRHLSINGKIKQIEMIKMPRQQQQRSLGEETKEQFVDTAPVVIKDMNKVIDRSQRRIRSHTFKTLRPIVAESQSILQITSQTNSQESSGAALPIMTIRNGQATMKQSATDLMSSDQFLTETSINLQQLLNQSQPIEIVKKPDTSINSANITIAKNVFIQQDASLVASQNDTKLIRCDCSQEEQEVLTKLYHSVQKTYNNAVQEVQRRQSVLSHQNGPNEASSSSDLFSSDSRE